MKGPPIISITEKSKKSKFLVSPQPFFNPSVEIFHNNETKRRRGDLQHIVKAIFDVKCASSIACNVDSYQTKSRSVESHNSYTPSAGTTTSMQNVDNTIHCLSNPFSLKNASSEQLVVNLINPHIISSTCNLESSKLQMVFKESSTVEINTLDLNNKFYPESFQFTDEREALPILELPSTPPSISHNFLGNFAVCNTDIKEYNSFLKTEVAKEFEMKDDGSGHLRTVTQSMNSVYLDRVIDPIAKDTIEMNSTNQSEKSDFFLLEKQTKMTSNTIPFCETPNSALQKAKGSRPSFFNKAMIDTQEHAVEDIENEIQSKETIVSPISSSSCLEHKLVEVSCSTHDDGSFKVTNSFNTNNEVSVVNAENCNSSIEKLLEDLNMNMLLIENDEYEETVVIIQSGEATTRKLRSEDGYFDRFVCNNENFKAEELSLERDFVEEDQKGLDISNQDCNCLNYPTLIYLLVFSVQLWLLILSKALTNCWKSCLNSCRSWYFLRPSNRISEVDTRFITVADEDLRKWDSHVNALRKVDERSHIAISAPTTPSYNEGSNNNVYNYGTNNYSGSISNKGSHSSDKGSSFAYDAIYPNLSNVEEMLITFAEANHLNNDHVYYPTSSLIQPNFEEMVVSYDLIYDISQVDSIPAVPAATQVVGEATTAPTAEAMNLTDIYPENHDKVCSPSLIQSPEAVKPDISEEEMLLEPSILFSSPQEKITNSNCRSDDDDFTASTVACSSVDVFDSPVVDMTIVYDDKDVVEQQQGYLVQLSHYYRSHNTSERLEAARQ